MPLTTGSRLGPYEIVGLLGAGGMGEVYRARDTKLRREVALKILPELFAADPERLVPAIQSPRPETLMLVDRSGRAQPLREVETFYLNELSVSPDGRRVAVRVTKASDDVHVPSWPRVRSLRYQTDNTSYSGRPDRKSRSARFGCC